MIQANSTLKQSRVTISTMNKLFTFRKRDFAPSSSSPSSSASSAPPPPPPPPPPSRRNVTFDIPSNDRNENSTSSSASAAMEAFDETLLRIPEDPHDHVVEAHPESRNPTNVFKRIRRRMNLKEIVDDEELLAGVGKGGEGRGGGAKEQSSSDIPSNVIRFVCLSDTHNKAHWLLEPDWWKSFNVPTDIFVPTPLPTGDVLLHCGDFTNFGRKEEVAKFDEFLGRIRYPIKIVVAGNHELTFDPNCRFTSNSKSSSSSSRSSAHPSNLITNAIYLQDGGVSIGGIRVWASPWQPVLGNMAFNQPRGESLLKKWNDIPSCGGTKLAEETLSSRGAARRNSAEEARATEREMNGEVAVDDDQSEDGVPKAKMSEESAPGASGSKVAAPEKNGDGEEAFEGGPSGDLSADDPGSGKSAPTSSIDVLMTHGPPLGIGDALTGGHRVVGCVELLATVRQRVRPKFHVFGHVHESNGCWTDGTTTFINAAINNQMHYPMQKVWKFDLELPAGVDKEDALRNWTRFGT